LCQWELIYRVYQTPPVSRHRWLSSTGFMPYKHYPKYQHFMLFLVPVYLKYEIWRITCNTTFNEFHLSTILLLNANFLISSLDLLLNNFLEWPHLPLWPKSKNKSVLTLYIPLIILNVSIKSLLILLVWRHISPKCSNLSL